MVESAAHLFHDCPFSALIWRGLLLKLGYSRGNTQTWEHEIQWCLTFFYGNDLISSIKKLVFTSFIYQIWRERNNRIFAATSNSSLQVSLLITQDIQLKLSAHIRFCSDIPANRYFMKNWNIYCIFTPKIWKPCWWIGPDEDEIMINSDGSLTENSAGFGALLRTRSGEVVDCAYGGSQPILVAAHELQGVKLGLRLAIEHNLSKIHIMIDSITIVLLLKMIDPKPPWNSLSIWRRVCLMLSQFERVKISHCFREINRAADFLAGIHPSCKFIRLATSQFSHDLQTILLEDSSRKVYFR